MKEKISIIVPIYNVEGFLHRCIDSIINQTYKNLEIILIDDGSSDNSGVICDEYAQKDGRIKVIHKKNGGVSEARNVGLKYASGNYIGFVDSDDWLEPNMYEIMINKIKSYDSDMIRCSYYKEGKVQDDVEKHAFEEESFYDLSLCREEIIELLINGKLNAYLWVTLIKRECVFSIHPFNTNVSMREDLIWMINLICSIKSFCYIPQKLYHYYQNPNGATRSKEHKKRNIIDMVSVYNDVKEAVVNNRISKEEIINLLTFSIYFKISSKLAIYLFDTKDKSILYELLDNNKFLDLISNVNLNELSIVNKTIIFLIKKRKINFLYVFMIFRQWLRRKIFRGADYE